MALKCGICEHPKRDEIEAAMLNSGDPEAVAREFDVDAAELKQHSVMCGEKDSIARRLKLREADLLEEVTSEYMGTLKAMGKRLRALSDTDSGFYGEEQDIMCAKLMTKPMVDLYTGVGGELRQTIRTMAELDKLLNGESDTSSSGLNALANAIVNSRVLVSEGFDPTKVGAETTEGVAE